jgi:CheY-like chemotaxis protein
VVGAGRSILVVEDDEDIRSALAELLRYEGFSVDSVANGRDAFRWLRDHDIRSSVVILDLMLPVMDGETFMTLAESDRNFDDLQVILISASATTSYSGPRPGPNHRVVERISKPIEIPQLLAAIASCG